MWSRRSKMARQVCTQEHDLKTRTLTAGFKVLTIGLLAGCATLHSAQVGDVDSQTVLTGERFEIKLVELGVDIEEVGEIARDLSKYTKREDEADTVVDLIKMANSGPSTGYPVFDVKYSDSLIDKLKSACPSGKVSGLTSVRETADYGLVSGEIVKLIGYCAKGE